MNDPLAPSGGPPGPDRPVPPAPWPTRGAAGDGGQVAQPERRTAGLADFTLREAHVLDRRGRFGAPVDVAVRAGVIQAIGPGLALDRSAVDVDARGLWLMPGVVDCHAHVTQSTYDPLELMTTPLSGRYLASAGALRAAVHAGVTGLRDAGGADAGLRDALFAGVVPGPRLTVCVVPLSRTGRHGDGALLGPGLESAQEVLGPEYPGRPAHTVTAAGDLPTAVRGVLRAGADWVLIHASGGVLSAPPVRGGSAPDLPFTRAQLTEAVAEAARYRRPVMMHALGDRAVETAAAAGARSIEHGIGLGERAGAAMAARGVTLVPTLSAYLDLAALAGTGVLPGWAVERAEATAAALAETIAVARAAGVSIALGSDARHHSRHGGNLAEITHLRRAGLTPPEALLAATANGARLCGVGDRLGRIETGYVLDAILLDEDPADLELFTRPDAVRGVFVGGRAVLAHPRLPAELVPPGSPVWSAAPAAGARTPAAGQTSHRTSP
ncbi:Amidohydrolase, imidazolonepropionase [Frankia canadensis]|uniref:Amidohydrolase, imidazolonepropionase n=1 Tax=Frankia canadensis TaxID=1836972 RepID=A0A2I2KR16_9ACTN|nr:amidohydrolase family protein [Frankia canadensis]SNQ48099.1 Amidohydrolase, imidazolonepropionase [Frankia canadensis]SOU55389.1 Amidohydrolase, imidazolonepropionase [Frankia canadensis]